RTGHCSFLADDDLSVSVRRFAEIENLLELRLEFKDQCSAFGCGNAFGHATRPGLMRDEYLRCVLTKSGEDNDEKESERACVFHCDLSVECFRREPALCRLTTDE